ncbi:ABC transporter substrate-binding protein [Leisingera sp. S232]|uniref:ABC transporter substrate-binding protein n=1 Tax=Leisingera sp. S232 TaxID=3415132 RepID=UPI003C7D0B68
MAIGFLVICFSCGFGLISVYRAAFKAAGTRILREVQYAPETTDPGPVVDPMLESGADILCWCSSYAPMVHALTEYAYAKGFQGQIISCTMDGYDRLVARTSPELMEGVVFQFPDFDDPMLREKAFFFNRPHVFFAEYNRRFPETWSAVSWEYVAMLDIWHSAVEKAGSVATPSVLAAMKQLGHVTHAFGHAEWWGEEIFGISNALIGDWPVVTVQDSKARIAAFKSIPDWLAAHSGLLKSELAALGQLWHQRLESGGPGGQVSSRAVQG